MMNATRSWVGAGTVVFAGAFLPVWGCLSESRVHEISPSHEPALHAVHGERLPAKMKSINANHRRAARLPIRVMREREFRNLQRCAEEFAAAAASLPELADLRELSSEDRAVFERLAHQLRENAEALKRAAANKDRVAARESFAKLTSTCNGCHAAFRHPVAGADGGGS